MIPQGVPPLFLYTAKGLPSLHTLPIFCGRFLLTYKNDFGILQCCKNKSLFKGDG